MSKKRITLQRERTNRPKGALKTGVQPPGHERIKVRVGCFDAATKVMLGASAGQLWGSSGDSGTFLPLFRAACTCSCPPPFAIRV